MNIKEALEIGNKTLQNKDVESYFLDARLLLSKALNITTEEIIFNLNRNISESELKTYQELIIRRADREPMSHILGKRAFWDWEFKVTKETLDPRPDSEAVIEAILKIFPDKLRDLDILELGIGTGCLIISALKLYPNSHGEGVDINKKTIDVAKENAETLEVDDRIKIYKSDWFSEVKGSFDLIISNPPYIPESQLKTLEKEVKLYEPKRALTSGKEGLDDYRKISQNVYNYLKKSGYLVLEIGDDQKDSVVKIFEEKKLTFLFSQKDLSNKDRVLVFQKSSI